MSIETGYQIAQMNNTGLVNILFGIAGDNSHTVIYQDFWSNFEVGILCLIF